MVQKRETKAINKLCVREILSLSFLCGAYFFEFRGRNLVCFVIAHNFNGKYAPEAGKTRMRTAFSRTHVFETRTATGSKLFSLLTYPQTTTFTMLNIFSPLEISSTKIWEKMRSWHEKCSLQVAVRVSKTLVLKLFEC